MSDVLGKIASILGAKKEEKPWIEKDELGEKEKENILSELNRQHIEMRNGQKEARRRWSKLEAYVEGRQLYDWLKKQAVGHEVAAAPSPDGDIDSEFTIVNDMRRIHVSNVQRLTAYSISVNVVPNSKRPEDKVASRLGRIALSDMFREVGEEKLKIRIARLIGLYGSVFVKVYFDPTKGRMIHPVRTRMELDPQTGMEVPRPYIDESVLEPEGQVVIEAISPRNILLPKNTGDLAKSDELEEVHVETVDFVYRRWGAKIEPEDIEMDTWDTPENSDSENPEVETSRAEFKNHVVVKTRYIRPCPRYPKGAIITYTKKEILESRPLTDNFEDIPCFGAVAIYDDKSPFGASWLWDLIPLQDGVNEVVTAMINHVKLYGDQKLFIPAEANIDPDKINNSSGEHILYHGQKAPDFMRPPELQNAHFSVFNLIRQLEMSLGAAHDISRANRALSGNAISNLQEIDDTVLRPALRSIEEMLQKASCVALKLMAELYTTNRLIKMSGMQGWQIEENFKGEMLRGNFHATISLMSGLPSNKAFRLEYLKTLYKDQIIDRDEARAYLEFANTDDMLEEIQKENEVVDNIIKDITNEENYLPDGTCLSVPHMFDNHELLVKKLLLFMRENYDHQSEKVKAALQERLAFSQNFLSLSAQPGMPEPDMMDPTKAGMPPMGPLGPLGPGGGGGNPEAGKDSFQNPSQQPPDRRMISQPGNTGMTA